MYRFYLTYNNVQTEVEEPKGWSDFKSEIKRDFKSHGVIFKYTSGTLKLGFADGRNILEDAFQLEGFDAQVCFTVDRRQTNTDVWVNEFEGNAVMKNRELTDLYFNIDFEVSTFQQKVINRLDTKVKLDATVDLDGDPMSDSLHEEETFWNTLRIKTDYDATFQAGGVSTDFTSFSNTNTQSDISGADVIQYLLLDYVGIIDGELQEYLNNTNGFKADTLTEYNLICGVAGTLTFTYEFKFELDGTVTLLDDVGQDTKLTYEIILRHENSSGVLQSETILDTGNSGTSASPVTHDFGLLTKSGSHQLTVTNGDLVYYVLKVIGDGTNNTTLPYGIRSALNCDVYHNSQVTYSVLKDSGSKPVKYSLIHDVINRVLYTITGENNRLNSEFLGLTEQGYSSDGCGGKTVLTNGEKLRGITSALNLSLKDILDSVMAIWGLGWGFEMNYNGLYNLRIEPMEHFYRDGEILDLGNPLSIKEQGSYIESTFDDLVLNKVEIGYNEFSNDEDFSNSIEDFLTVAEYSLPISTVKNTYTQKSPLITSGRLVQATFEQTDITKKWKLDQKTFLVAVRRAGSFFVPENDENFVTVNGLDDKTTAYNIRHAPVYMFLNHALIINSALKGKSLDEIIQNTGVAINQDFEAQFDSGETCLLADEQRLLRTSSGNITIGNNYSGLRLFEPIKHELTVAMTQVQLNAIIDAMENNSTDPNKDLGYLSYKDNEGNPQQGYPIIIQWNPNDEIADITTLEKADNYGI
jgi:hypothetical protein